MPTPPVSLPQPMRFGRRSVLQLSPDPGWEAEITEDDGTLHTLPVIGWAVYVHWVGYESQQDQADEGGANIETSIEAVVVDPQDGPMAMPEFLDNRADTKYVRHVVRRVAT